MLGQHLLLRSCCALACTRLRQHFHLSLMLALALTLPVPLVARSFGAEDVDFFQAILAVYTLLLTGADRDLGDPAAGVLEVAAFNCELE